MPRFRTVAQRSRPWEPTTCALQPGLSPALNDLSMPSLPICLVWLVPVATSSG